jgi:uncharacterized Zn finger protein
MKIIDYKKVVNKRDHVLAYAKMRGSNGDVVYDVARYDNRSYRCTCPDNLYRYPKKCKHINAFVQYETLLKARRKK